MSEDSTSYLGLPSPALFGHRGCRGAAPENTLAAFAIARDAKADGVELDVRPTRDGVLVVMHDPTLERTASDPRAVAALDFAALATVRVDGERVPTLEEVLRFCRVEGLAVNVELKRDVPSRVAATRLAARLLGRAEPGKGLVVSSFDPVMLALFRALAPKVPTALLLEPETDARYPLDVLAPRLGRAVHPDRALVSEARMRSWKARGLWVAAWTVNDPHEQRRLVSLGVDALICDDPFGARRLLDETRDVRA